MFRDLKEYQEIAKIYAEKVSKPENLEERRGSSVQQLAQNRANAFKPATPPQGGAGGGVGNPTNVRGSGAKPRPKPEVKKLPTTAEIRAANPGKVGGGNAGASTDSGGTSQSTIKSVEQKPAPQEKPTQPAPQAKPQSKFIKKDKGVGMVKRGTPGAQRAENKEKAKLRAKEMFKQRQADKAAGKPQLSGKERAQAMAKARLAAKNKPTATATPEKSAAPQEKQAPQAQQKAVVTPSKEQTASKKQVVKNINQSGGGKTVNVGGKDVDLSKVGPGMKKRLMQKNVGTNASKEVEKVNPKPGQTVNVKQDPKTGSVSSKVTGKPTGDTSQIIGMDKKTGEKKLQNMQQKNKPFDDFDNEIDNLIQNTPTVNSKGKKVKKIPESKQYDAYDIVLEYLLSSEQVATIEEANYVMTEMDAETIQGIVNEADYFGVPKNIRDANKRLSGPGPHSTKDKRDVLLYNAKKGKV